jgi:hypothetical protein
MPGFEAGDAGLVLKQRQGVRRYYCTTAASPQIPDGTEHRAGRLPRGHHRPGNFSRGKSGERRTDQWPGSGGVDAGPKDALNVVAEMKKGKAQ